MAQALLGAGLALAGTLLPFLPARVSAQEAQQTPASALQVSASDTGAHLEWQAQDMASSGATGDMHLPLQPYGGYLLPMQTVTVRYIGDSAPSASVITFDAAPWDGELTRATDLEPAVLDWEPAVHLAPVYAPLPSEPFFLLRSGHARGQPVAVYAFSEVYQDRTGALHRVESGEWTLPGASLESGATWLEELGSGTAPVTASSTGYLADAQPTNALSTRRSIKVYVSRQGIQAIRAGELREAGLTEPDAERLRLFLRGQEVPLHVQDRNNDGRINGDEAIRFYADRPGDVWNDEDVYWLIEGGAPGKRMTWRDVTPDGAPLRTLAYATGVWSDNRLYESALFGPDRDNWFHAMIDQDGAAGDASSDTVTASLDTSLPLAVNAPLESVFSVGGTAIDLREDLADMTPVAHRLRLSGETVSHTDATGDWLIDFGLEPSFDFVHTVRTTGATQSLYISLASAPEPTRIYVDHVQWQQPVRLDFGGKGAAFRGVAGVWRYRLTHVANDVVLYDVTDAANPRILGRTNGNEHLFQDGPDVHDYVLAAEGTVHTPLLAAHEPIAVADMNAADVVYIAPAAFHAALEPLLQQRRDAGLVALTVDVQELYDGWGYGFVDPDAIRNFLRGAAGAWQRPPIAAVLVGDGTHDPRNYLGLNNPNHIPPYLADVDPWIRITPCDNCYAQLDGDDPLAESAFLLDILLGRLPVATVTELDAVVDKLLHYERAAESAPSSWRNVSVQLADDWVYADGTKDSAGNFPWFVERIGEMQPPGIRYSRLFYNADVDPGLLDPATSQWLDYIGPWTEPDADQARSRARALLSQGAGLVTFTGHAHHWLWARLGDTGGYDNRLFGLWDVTSLSNRDELFIALSMTCLTAQFSEPAEYHFTLDEHLLLHPNGGAVAVWGPAGLSVAHGHDALQVGFYDKLWSATTTPGHAAIGALVQAGYDNVSLRTACCQDVTRTFVLLGDPLTPARVQPLNTTYLSGIHATPSGQP